MRAARGILFLATAFLGLVLGQHPDSSRLRGQQQQQQLQKQHSNKSGADSIAAETDIIIREPPSFAVGKNDRAQDAPAEQQQQENLIIEDGLKERDDEVLHRRKLHPRRRRHQSSKSKTSPGRIGKGKGGIIKRSKSKSSKSRASKSKVGFSSNSKSKRKSGRRYFNDSPAMRDTGPARRGVRTLYPTFSPWVTDIPSFMSEDDRDTGAAIPDGTSPDDDSIDSPTVAVGELPRGRDATTTFPTFVGERLQGRAATTAFPTFEGETAFPTFVGEMTQDAASTPTS